MLDLYRSGLLGIAVAGCLVLISAWIGDFVKIVLHFCAFGGFSRCGWCSCFGLYCYCCRLILSSALFGYCILWFCFLGVVLGVCCVVLFGWVWCVVGGCFCCFRCGLILVACDCVLCLCCCV